MHLVKDLAVDLLGGDVALEAGVVDDVEGLAAHHRRLNQAIMLVYYEAREKSVSRHDAL
jgi:hypothetical protein